ncbi:hypothetical protein KCP78_04270 [Salmonella enterica subsp. enterica]|nr:hypothetical protein KCP78_04270 [Salmonella enterica subsp. enterica]
MDAQSPCEAYNTSPAPSAPPVLPGANVSFGSAFFHKPVLLRRMSRDWRDRPHGRGITGNN